MQDDSYSGSIEVTVHEDVNTILVVTWDQLLEADGTWLEFSFEGSDVMRSPLAPGSVGEHSEVVLGVRPEGVSLGRGPLSAVVEAVEPMGRETLYVLDTPLGTLRALEAGAQRSFRPGDRIQFDFETRDTLLFDVASERRLPARVGLVA